MAVKNVLKSSDVHQLVSCGIGQGLYLHKIKVYILLVSVHQEGNSFCSRYKYMFLKKGLVKYPVCVSLTDIGKLIPFSSFPSTILSILFR